MPRETRALCCAAPIFLDQAQTSLQAGPAGRFQTRSARVCSWPNFSCDSPDLSATIVPGSCSTPGRRCRSMMERMRQLGSVGNLHGERGGCVAGVAFAGSVSDCLTDHGSIPRAGPGQFVVERRGRTDCSGVRLTVRCLARVADPFAEQTGIGRSPRRRSLSDGGAICDYAVGARWPLPLVGTAVGVVVSEDMASFVKRSANSFRVTLLGSSVSWKPDFSATIKLTSCPSKP